MEKLQARSIFQKKNRWRRHRRHVLKDPSMGLPSSSMARPISFPSFPVHHKVARRFGQIRTERWRCFCFCICFFAGDVSHCGTPQTHMNAAGTKKTPQDPRRNKKEADGAGPTHFKSRPVRKKWLFLERSGHFLEKSGSYVTSLGSLTSLHQPQEERTQV